MENLEEFKRLAKQHNTEIILNSPVKYLRNYKLYQNSYMCMYFSSLSHDIHTHMSHIIYIFKIRKGKRKTLK